MASMFSGDGVVGSSFNNDVLDAQPQDESAKEKLVDEIKSRAKGCLTSGNLPECIRLYTKAAELTAAKPPACAIIHANRSMVHSKMGNFASGLDDAILAIEKDPSYIKGYFRKATALAGLEDFAGAKAALQTGLELKPDDKEMVAMMDKVHKQQEAATTKKGSSSRSSNSIRPAAIPATKPATAVPAAPSSGTKSSNRSSSSSSAVVVDDEDAGTVSEMRGYKKTADGRTTTFFNRELDETAKSLIGDIAPKKLDSGSEAADAATVAAAAAGGGSAWNTAGTYEEKILSDWAVDHLRVVLGDIEYNIDSLELPAALQPLVTALQIDSAHMAVTEAAGVQGHAQVSVARGKRKYLADMSADLKWTLTLSRAEEGAAAWVIKGTANVIDISADREVEWQEVTVSTNPSATKSSGISAKEVGEFVKHLVRVEQGAHSLHTATLTAVGRFCDELKTK